MLLEQVRLPRKQRAKTQRHQGLQQRKDLFTRQPSEVMGGQVSYLVPQRRGTCDITV